MDLGDPRTSYMVVPFLRRPIDSPPFETVRDIVDFVNQMLASVGFLTPLVVSMRPDLVRK